MGCTNNDPGMGINKLIYSTLYVHITNIQVYNNYMYCTYMYTQIGYVHIDPCTMYMHANGKLLSICVYALYKEVCNVLADCQVQTQWKQWNFGSLVLFSSPPRVTTSLIQLIHQSWIFEPALQSLQCHISPFHLSACVWCSVSWRCKPLYMCAVSQKKPHTHAFPNVFTMHVLHLHYFTFLFNQSFILSTVIR